MTTELQADHEIESVFLDCTEPVEQLVYDGWLVRRARDDVKRASSVNVQGPGRLPLADKVEQCEAMYRSAGLPPLFRLAAPTSPDGLDEALEARGYRAFERSLVQVADVAAVGAPAPAGLRLEWPETSDWTEAAGRLRGRSRAEIAAEARRIGHVPAEARGVLGYLGDEPVACGLSLQRGTFAGLFDVFVAPAARGAGFGGVVSRELLLRARAAGAETGWLSVLADNDAALRTYAKLGFRTAYDYWYRVKA